MTTSSIGVPASLRSPVRCMLATSIDSIAPLRAAKTFVPSGETASASGVPVVRMLPAPRRVARSMTETVRPAATYARAAVRRGRHGARAAGQRDAAGHAVVARVEQDGVRRIGRDDHDARLRGDGEQQEERETGEERAHETD